MNVKLICDYLGPLITSGSLALPYKACRPARKIEADLEDLEAELPLCLVHPWKEVVSPNRYDNFVSQRGDEQFAIVTVCKIEDLSTLRRQVLDPNLLGKVLPTYTDDIVAIGGEVINVEATVIWWRDIYQTSIQRRQTP